MHCVHWDLLWYNNWTKIIDWVHKLSARYRSTKGRTFGLSSHRANRSGIENTQYWFWQNEQGRTALRDNILIPFFNIYFKFHSVIDGRCHKRQKKTNARVHTELKRTEFNLDKSELVHINPFTDDSLVEQEDVGSHTDASNSEDPCPDCSSGWLTAGHLLKGSIHARERLID